MNLIQKWRKRKIAKLLYPNGWWGGYAQYFEPSLRGKDGQIFIDKCRCVLASDHNIIDNIDSLCEFLSTPHQKDVWDSGKGRPNTKIGTTLCCPTDEAKRLIYLLEDLKRLYK